MKSWRLNVAGNVSRNGDGGNMCTFLIGKPKGKDQFGGLNVRGCLKSKWP